MNPYIAFDVDQSGRERKADNRLLRWRRTWRCADYRAGPRFLEGGRRPPARTSNRELYPRTESSGYGGFAQQRAWEQVAMSSIDHTPDQLRDETRPRGATLILVALAAILLFMMLSPRTPVVSDRGIGPRAVTESPGPIPSTERRPKPYP